MERILKNKGVTPWKERICETSFFPVWLCWCVGWPCPCSGSVFYTLCFGFFLFAGTPSAYYDVMNVDWLPTLHLKDPSTSVEDATSEENESKLDANTTSEQAFRILTKINESQRQEFSDTFNIFGQHVANKLRTYPHRTRCDVQHKINEILYEADMSFYEVGKVVAEQMSQQQQQQSQQQQSSSKSTKRQRTSTKRVTSNASATVPALNLTNKSGESSLLQTALAAASAINSQPKKIKMERKSPIPEVLNLKKTVTNVEIPALTQAALAIGSGSENGGNKPTSGIFYIQHRPSSGQSNCVDDEEDDPILPSQSEI